MLNNENLNQRFVYNPILRFRNERDRCVAYTVDDFFHVPGNIVTMYPFEVIFLLIFDGTVTNLQALKHYAYLFNIDYTSDTELLEKINK